MNNLTSHSCGRGRLRREVWGSKEDCPRCQAEAERVRTMRQQLGITPISVADTEDMDFGVIVFTDNTIAPLIDGVIPKGVKLTAATNAIITVALSFGLGVCFAIVFFIQPSEIVDVSFRAWGLK